MQAALLSHIWPTVDHDAETIIIARVKRLQKHILVEHPWVLILPAYSIILLGIKVKLATCKDLM